MAGKSKKRGSKSSGNSDGSGKKAPRKSDAGIGEEEGNGDGGGDGSSSGGGKAKPRCNVDIFNEDAMQNAYYTCHNVQDLLKCRGFPWPGAQKKKKKGKRK